MLARLHEEKVTISDALCVQFISSQTRGQTANCLPQALSHNESTVERRLALTHAMSTLLTLWMKRTGARFKCHASFCSARSWFDPSPVPFCSPSIGVYLSSRLTTLLLHLLLSRNGHSPPWWSLLVSSTGPLSTPACRWLLDGVKTAEGPSTRCRGKKKYDAIFRSESAELFSARNPTHLIFIPDTHIFHCSIWID